MRAILGVVLALVVLWSGYWFWGQSNAKARVTALIEHAQHMGFIAAAEDISVQGFPNRFDVTVEDPVLGDEALGVVWTSPFIQALSISYKPWHQILSYANKHTITTPSEIYDLEARQLQSSFFIIPGEGSQLERMVTVGDTFVLEAVSDPRWNMSADSFRLSSTRVSLEPESHKIGMALQGVLLGPAFANILSGERGNFFVDARVDFTKNAQGEARFSGAEIEYIRGEWGRISITITGALKADKNARLNGELDIAVRGWRRLAALLEGHNYVSAPIIATMTNLLAKKPGEKAFLHVPLTFVEGNMTLGGVLPLGPAPLMQ